MTDCPTCVISASARITNARVAVSYETHDSVFETIRSGSHLIWEARQRYAGWTEPWPDSNETLSPVRAGMVRSVVTGRNTCARLRRGAAGTTLAPETAAQPEPF